MHGYPENTPSYLQTPAEDLTSASPPVELTFTALIPAADLAKAQAVTENLAIELGSFAVPGTVSVNFGETAPSPLALQEKYKLSDREFEVATLAAQGLANDEIGQRLGLTQATVKGYVSSTLSKTHTNNRTHLVATLFGLIKSTD